MSYPNRNLPAHLPDHFRWLKYDGTYYMSPESWAKNSWDYPTLNGPGEFVIYRSYDEILCVPVSVKRLDDTELRSTDRIRVGDTVWMEVISHGPGHKWIYVKGEVLYLNPEQNFAQVRFNGGEWVDDYPTSSLFLRRPSGDPIRRAFLFEENA